MAVIKSVVVSRERVQVNSFLKFCCEWNLEVLSGLGAECVSEAHLKFRHFMIQFVCTYCEFAFTFAIGLFLYAACIWVELLKIFM